MGGDGSSVSAPITKYQKTIDKMCIGKERWGQEKLERILNEVWGVEEA